MCIKRDIHQRMFMKYCRKKILLKGKSVGLFEEYVFFLNLLAKNIVISYVVVDKLTSVIAKIAFLK